MSLKFQPLKASSGFFKLPFCLPISIFMLLVLESEDKIMAKKITVPVEEALLCSNDVRWPARLSMMIELTQS